MGRCQVLQTNSKETPCTVPSLRTNFLIFLLCPLSNDIPIYPPLLLPPRIPEASLYTTTHTTCISTHRNITVENMSEKSFGNNPTHQNSSSQILAAGTARPALPLRKLYGMRLGLAGITLALMAQIFLAIFYPSSLNYFPVYTSSPILVTVLYWALQITATVFYLRSRYLGFILGANIVGALHHGLDLFMLIFLGLLYHPNGIGHYLEGANAVYIIAYWLGQAVTLIDFTLCIVFIIVLMRVFSRRRQSTVQF